MHYWIDYEMLLGEIRLHRNNAQRRVKAYREIENPTEFDKLQCREAVGEETVLMCLQAWINDFKFSIQEMKEFDDVKKEWEGNT